MLYNSKRETQKNKPSSAQAEIAKLQTHRAKTHRPRVRILRHLLPHPQFHSIEPHHSLDWGKCRLKPTQ